MSPAEYRQFPLAVCCGLLLANLAVGGVGAAAAAPSSTATHALMAPARPPSATGSAGRVAVPPGGANASIVHQGDRVLLRATDSATVRGRASLSTGANVTVRIRSDGNSSESFLRTRDATVRADGTFSATFDLSDVPVDASRRIEVAVLGPDGGTLVEVPGALFPADEVLTSPPNPTATPTPSPTDAGMPTRTATRATVDPGSTTDPATPTGGGGTTGETAPGFGPAATALALGGVLVAFAAHVRR